jgi:hypothetical protein
VYNKSDIIVLMKVMLCHNLQPQLVVKKSCVYNIVVIDMVLFLFLKKLYVSVSLF